MLGYRNLQTAMIYIYVATKSILRVKSHFVGKRIVITEGIPIGVAGSTNLLKVEKIQ